jgi:hypothetical protein
VRHEPLAWKQQKGQIMQMHHLFADSAVGFIGGYVAKPFYGKPLASSPQPTYKLAWIDENTY